MKTRSEVTPEKLRGGFYTPDPLVDLCVERVSHLVGDRAGLRVLEPSAGDGAFVRGIGRSSLSGRIESVDAIELVDQEAAKCSLALREAGVRGTCTVDSAVRWASSTESTYDAAVGNPPYVRFQFVSETDRRSAVTLADRMDVSFAGVSNLWLPVVLGALGRLRVGGAFAFVVPAECFTGVSARVIREWLVANAAELRFDLFRPGSFPGVLQEVVVMSGQRRDPSPGPIACTIVDRVTASGGTSTRHSIGSGRRPWTRYLLTAEQLAAVDRASELAVVTRLGLLARFEVAAVTGANDFFAIDSPTAREHGLRAWSRPLLPRIRHAPGLRYTEGDHEAADAAGARVHLLDFSAERPDPELSPGPSAYLREGEVDGLPARYKCRIRTPWYRVPFIRPGALLMSKRSHHYPRVVMNQVGAVTTDTIYRGSLQGAAVGRSDDLVAGFHNTLTLLSAELEGRSFGGGVLELVPTEVSSLVVPFVPGFGVELDRLDAVARAASDPQDLVDETDRLLVKADVGIDQELLDLLAAGRASLSSRRLARTGKSA